MSEGFTGIKDVDKLIIQNMDTRTFLNTYQIKNKYIHSLFSDNVFKNRAEKEFPNVRRFGFISWKQFYFDLIYWVNLLKEKYGFESRDFKAHPKEYRDIIDNYLIKWLNIDNMTSDYVIHAMNNMLYEAIRVNDIDFIKFAIGKGANNYQGALNYAASFGNIESFEYLRENYPNLNLEKALIYAINSSNRIKNKSRMIEHIQTLIDAKGY
jgi:hypothetical protein